MDVFTLEQIDGFVRDADALRNDLNGCMQERASNVACSVKAMAAEIQTLSHTIALLSVNERSKLALEAMQEWGHYVVPLRRMGNLSWKLRTPLGHDFDLPFLMECDEKRLSVFGGCFFDAAEALIVGAEQLEKERRERLERA